MKPTANLKDEVARLRKNRLNSKPSLIQEARMGTILQWMKDLQLQDKYSEHKKSSGEKGTGLLTPREFIQEYIQS